MSDERTHGNGAATLSGIDFADMRAHLTDGYIIKGVLSPNTLAAVIGATSSGKTFFATDMAMHIAAAKSWRGRKMRGGLVVYAALEAPVSAENRFVAARTHCGFSPGIALRLTPGPLNLRDPADVVLLIAFVRETESAHGEKCVTIFIDTLARAMAGGDENRSEDMGALVAGADAVRQATGATVVLVHHLGKDETRGARGWSGFKAALDTEIEVVKKNEGLRIATVIKQRDFPDGLQLPFRLRSVELGRDQDDDPVTTCVVEATDELPAAADSRKPPTGKNQTKLLTAIMEWKRSHPDSDIINSLEMRAMAKAQSMTKKSSFEAAIAGLQKFAWLQPCVGGWKFLADPKL
jgi:hypothetical protein